VGLALGACPILATDISGIWKAEFDSQIGAQKYTYTFKQDGTNLTGEADSDIGGEKHQAKISDGSVVGDTVSFVELMHYQDNDVRITYTGTVQTNEIKFGRQVGDFAHEDVVARLDTTGTNAPMTTNSMVHP
jgi:hypothetical protein